MSQIENSKLLCHHQTLQTGQTLGSTAPLKSLPIRKDPFFISSSLNSLHDGSSVNTSTSCGAIAIELTIRNRDTS